MIRGFLSPLRPFQIRGWAFESDKPDQYLAVEIRLDGKKIGQVTANRYYDHLAAAGIGEGDHGFVFNTDRQLPIHASDRLEVIAQGESDRTARLAYAVPPPSSRPKPDAPSSQPAPSVRSTMDFPGPASDAAQRPVFVLGSARSGTSAMAQALIASTRYVGQGEGHLLDLLPEMLGLVENSYAKRRGEWEAGINTMIAAAPPAFMLDAVRHGFVQLARTLFPRGFWVDKTPRPTMTLAAPALKSVWPEARFIFMKRRAIENIESRRRKFPAITFVDHCRDWVASMTNWEQVRDSLGSSAMEIDQIDLAHKTGEIVQQLQPFLSLTSQEATRLEQALALDRPEQTSSRFASIHAIGTLTWTEREILVFRVICDATMKRFGYTEEADYRA